MINVLIADDNIYYAKTLMDAMEDENIRVCNITITGQETLSVLKTRKDIDLILLNLQLPIYSGIQIIEELSEKYKERYNQSVIVISENDDLILKIKDNSIVCKCINKKQGIFNIVKSIENIIKNKRKKKRKEQTTSKILRQIEYLKYNKSYKGTKYLIDAIQVIMENECYDFSNLKKQVYPIVAIQNHTTISNVKNNINKATEQMYYECNHSILKKYFSFTEDVKPTTKNVIYTIISKMKKE